jgi:hypothetical protein
MSNQTDTPEYGALQARTTIQPRLYGHHVVIDHPHPFTPEEARELAAEILAAAGECEVLDEEEL